MKLFTGCDQIIDKVLRVPQKGTTEPCYEQTSALLSMVANRPSFDAHQLVSQLYDRIESNYLQLAPGRGKNPSQQNWRLEKRIDHSKDAKPEEKLERSIARVTDENWTNQMPVSSGLVDSGARRSGVDLVHLSLIHI